MKIGGFIKQSFIDWEEKVTAVIFTKGCNLRCGFCHNPELVYPKLIEQTEDINEKTIFNFLSTRKNWLDGVVITGGEPTLQNDLKSFIENIKKMGFAVKLDTNGTSPKVLKNLLKANLLDYVAMDIKTIFELETYQNICNIKDPELLTKVKESVEILKKSGIDYQLRTTVVPKYHTKEMIDKLQEKFSYCNYKTQEFRETKIIINQA
ncbi:MAG TPA: anaerobic ribonucleoside-triphosphate reductase activating protein [Bacteroidales bacterium]|nr:anaerobic ribonucleoside-triphosphate reductase activating protein [Bacteroidales bacterium]HQB22347.1 anaerobic ribonucleoside-triphosphate reductase activating protein [Bacteroidales bacterium]